MRLIKNKYLWGSLLILGVAGTIWVRTALSGPKSSFPATVSLQHPTPDSLLVEVTITAKPGLWVKSWSRDEQGMGGNQAQIQPPPPSRLQELIKNLIPDGLEKWLIPEPTIGTAKVSIHIERKENSPGQWTLTISESVSSNQFSGRTTISWIDDRKQRLEDYFELVLASGTYEIGRPIRLYREKVGYGIPSREISEWQNINLVVGSLEMVEEAAKQSTKDPPSPPKEDK